MFRTIQEIRDANEESDGKWFSPDTMRFFNSRVLGAVVTSERCAFFVTSEKYDYDAPRLYTVRRANADGSIDTVGDFQGYTTADSAKRAAWRESQKATLLA